jgi:N-sulfoglucosamine sulfohydrolase
VTARPNILQIVCHDLGRHLGCYGLPQVRTPNLDRLAAEGQLFLSSFCTSPGCSPSRAALATGRYPHSAGVLGLAHARFGWDLGPAELHCAAILGDAGYHTALFGLQHVTYHVERLGFAEHHPARPADAVTANLRHFLERVGRAEPGAPPFYAELNFFEPHRPFDYGDVSPDTDAGIYRPPYLPEAPAVLAELAAMQGAIRKVDHCIGEIEDGLARSGLRENTVVLFTADHGIAFPRAKGTLYDPGIQTALLLRWPAAIPGAARHTELVSNVDLLPTLLTAARVPLPNGLQGRSVMPLLRNEPYCPRTAIFAEKTFHNEYDPQRCIRTATHKLVVRFEVGNPLEVPADIMHGATYVEMLPKVVAPEPGHYELYDLTVDPLEQDNLAESLEHAELRDSLRRELLQWMRDTADPLLDGPVASPFYRKTVRWLLDG